MGNNNGQFFKKELENGSYSKDYANTLDFLLGAGKKVVLTLSIFSTGLICARYIIDWSKVNSDMKNKKH